MNVAPGKITPDENPIPFMSVHDPSISVGPGIIKAASGCAPEGTEDSVAPEVGGN